MKCVLMSIQSRHNRNIENRAKTSELRTRPPMCDTPFKVFTYESGVNGRHMVTNEWICRDITNWRTCMGVPIHLLNQACVTVEELKKYSDYGRKDIAELHISSLVIYDTPKALSEFYTTDYEAVKKCIYRSRVGQAEDVAKHGGWLKGSYVCDKTGETEWCFPCKTKPITRPPQSWRYILESEIVSKLEGW